MSFQLLRTNPLLTTNFKINIDTGLSLYLESIKSTSDLNNNKYEHYSINKESFLEDQLPLFYDGLPEEQAFYVKNDSDNDVIYNDYHQQFDDIYYNGSDYINDKSYDEEFEYFAPLYVRKNNLPDGFIILRVDNASIYNEKEGLYELGSINKNNFRSEIIDKWKSVAYFDMTTNSDFGYWLDRNINQNERFPINSFDFDARKITFSRWFGMDYKSGVYTQKPMFLDKTLLYEQPHFRMEEILTKGFKNNSLIYPHILNFNFLFDDTPATPERLKKYSLNRYFGFYVDELEFVTNLTSYITPELKSGTTLFNNIIISGVTGLTWDICEKEFDNVIPSVNPFKSDKWDDNKNYYIYIKDDLYQVNRFIDPETNIWIYKIISDSIMDEYWNVDLVYDKTVNINYDGNETFSYLTPFSDNFFIDPYTECISGETRDMYNDLYLIKINDRFHVLKNTLSGTTTEILSEGFSDTKSAGFSESIGTTPIGTTPISGYTSFGYEYYIQSDWGIQSNKSKLKYWIGGSNSEYYDEFNIENINRKPLVYSVYKIKFTDIKDFDFDRVNTKFANFDYEKTKYYETDEEKLYVKDYKSNTYPLEERRYDYGVEEQNKLMIISSEYIADEELYETKTSGDISDIWIKNQSICKWGFQGSISHSDYPYKLNNSKTVGNYYNRSVDVFGIEPNIYNKNLDYFYRVDNLTKGTGVTEDYVYYLNQTTNVPMEFISSLNGGRSFNIATYFEVNVSDNFDFDYFEYFFSNNMYIEDNYILYKDKFKKYSTFYGDNNITPLTFFKGLKIKLNEILDIRRSVDGKISKMISQNTGKYDNYKISIILNDVYSNESNALNNFNGIINIIDNGIHIIVNDIYKNILVIININLKPIDNAPSHLTGKTFNNIEYFGEKHGLYYGETIDGQKVFNYDPSLITAANFIESINNLNEKQGFDNYITFYHIYKNDGITEYKKSFINGTNNPIIPPIILSITKPDEIKVKRNSYKIELIKGPSTNDLYKRSTYQQKINKRDEYLSRRLIKNYDPDKYDTIYRYSGPYEPIFNDINLFNEGIFCIIDPIYTGDTISDYDEKNASNGISSSKSGGRVSINDLWKNWKSINNICSENTLGMYTYISVSSNITSETNTNYLILNGFQFNIPMNATVNGIEVTIIRKSHYDNSDSYVKDESILLTNDNYLNNYSVNKSNLSTWGTDFSSVTYGSSNDLWVGGNISSWGTEDINSSNFGVVIRTKVKNDTETNKILPDIKCVNVKVHYEYNLYYISGQTSYFERNVKFDESIYNFGKINEIIYSKVNIDNKNIFKFKDLKYPIVDQFGYGFIDRFIFKSDWDTEFYYNTIDSFEDDSTNYFIPLPKSLKTQSASTGIEGPNLN